MLGKLQISQHMAKLSVVEVAHVVCLASVCVYGLIDLIAIIGGER